MRRSAKAPAFALAALVAIPMAALAGSEDSERPSYEVEGKDLHILGDYGDNLVYDGVGVVESKGKAKVDVDPVANSGEIVVKWKDPRQTVADLVGATAPVEVRVVQTVFMPPGHPTGVISDGNQLRTIVGDPIPTNHFEHGSTGVGAPIVPSTFTYLASWGPAKVYIDGEFYGMMAMHTMLTEGVRDETTDQVYNADKTGFYSPMNPDDGFTDPDETQLHVIVRSFDMDTDNFPPFSTFWHLMFYDVEIEVKGTG